MKNKEGLVFVLSFVFLFSLSLGSSMEETNITDLDSFLENIPKINGALENEPLEIPGVVSSLVGDGNILVEISRDSGIESLYIVLSESFATSIFLGKVEDYNYKVSLSEETLNSLLESESALDELLLKVESDEIKIEAKGFFNKVKLFFAKFFI